MIIYLKKFGIMLLSICLLSACSSDPEVIIPRKTNSDLEQQVDKYLTEKQFNGTVLMAKGGEVWISKGYGMANFEKEIPNSPNTMFRIGSVSKQITALSILKLQEQNLLNVKDTLNNYIPDYPNGDTITIHHLLSHTSGIPEYLTFDSLTFSSFQNYNSPSDIIDTFKQKALDFTPGTQFSYSNSNYILLGYIIEKVSKESYEDYINNHIFKPLHMKHSGYDINDYNEDTHAKGYEGTVKRYDEPSYKIDMSVPFAAGALYSTVEDLFLWDQALYTDKLVSKESLDIMFSPKVIMEDNKLSYAYGWFVYHDPINLVGHGGNIFGYSSFILRDPETKNLIVVMTNFDSYREINWVAEDLNKLLDEFVK
jgi:CubicO group peptidase (beta-lactamase class C family)